MKQKQLQIYMYVGRLTHFTSYTFNKINNPRKRKKEKKEVFFLVIQFVNEIVNTIKNDNEMQHNVINRFL